MTRWIAIDTETTGLVPDVHDVWEIGIETDDGQQFSWLLESVRLATADAKSLEVGGFYDRWDLHGATKTPPAVAARELAKLTAGRHLVGVGIAFDAAFLDRFLRRHNRAPAWHYHLIDVAPMAYGWLAGRRALAEEFPDVPAGLAGPGAPALPWRSDDLSDLCDVRPPSPDERHTALGDARWAARWYRHLSELHPVSAQPASVPA